MLDITVWLDGMNVEITGTIEPSIVTRPSERGCTPLMLSPIIQVH